MNEYYKLLSTYDVMLEFSTNSRNLRIEILESVETKNKFKARVWDLTTYNLYPTFANIAKEGGIENKIFSCDEMNRDVTNLLPGGDPETLILGKVWDSEKQFLTHIKELVSNYHSELGIENA